MEVTSTVTETPIFSDPAVILTVNSGGTCTHEVILSVVHNYVYCY